MHRLGCTVMIVCGDWPFLPGLGTVCCPRLSVCNVQVFPQLDRKSCDMPRLVPADAEGRPYRLQRSGPYIKPLKISGHILHCLFETTHQCFLSQLLFQPSFIVPHFGALAHGDLSLNCMDMREMLITFIACAVQEFSSDMNSRPVKRIEDVSRLRTAQFTEDAGAMAHPIRPDSYIKMDNFYTLTVYEKGAEIVRLYRTLLGKDGFRCELPLGSEFEAWPLNQTLSITMLPTVLPC